MKKFDSRNALQSSSILNPVAARLLVTFALTGLLLCSVGCDPKPPSSGSNVPRNSSGTSAVTMDEIIAKASEPNSSIAGLEYFAGIPKEEMKLKNGQSAYIVVQHCLISFEGTGIKRVTRSKEEAEKLANELFKRATEGENFEKLVVENTDEPYEGRVLGPGVYKLANFGFPSFLNVQNDSDKISPRDVMVAAFGDVGFSLEVGEVGLAVFDAGKNEEGFDICPWGWHIIKRLK